MNALVKATPIPLLKVEEARRVIAECRRVDEVKQIRDQAAAIQAYLRQQRASKDIQNDAAEIKLRAERRVGEMLIESKQTGQRRIQGQSKSKKLGDSIFRAPTLAELGVHPNAAATWQQEARVPEERFEAYTKEARSKGEVTTAGLLAIAAAEKRTARRQERHEAMAPALSTDNRYSVLLADPPWRYEHVETESRAVENQYPTMTLDSICALPIADVAAENCVLFMWATSPKLAEAMRALDAWGFEYRTCAVWVKDKIGMGYYFRQRHELLLVAVRGNPPVPDERSRADSVISAPRKKHSEKPAEVHELIEKMYPKASRLELFARRAREGWSAWGNEVFR